MNEAARLHMLDAIGITPLVPRFVLAGARPSPQGEVVSLAATQAPIATPSVCAEQTAPVATPVSTPVAARPASGRRIDIDVPANAERRDKPALVVADNTASGESLRLQVCLYQHHPRLFSLLPLYRADFQPEVDQFVAAVVKAMGLSPQSLAPQIFRWPFVNNPKLDHGINALREALAGFVQQAVREPDSMLLLWGADLSRFLPVPVAGAHSEFVLGANLRVITTRRVQDYFNEPPLKRELWQQLCTLRPVLHGQ